MSSQPPKTYEYRPALAARKLRVEIAETCLSCFKKDELIWRVDYNEIKALRYASTPAREYRFRRLEILTKSGDTHKLGLNTTLTSTRDNDTHLAEYEGMVGQIALSINASRPDLSITLGEKPRIAWVMFFIGAVCVLFAVGLALAAMTGNVRNDRWSNILPPIMAMIAFGGLVCWNANPWRKMPDINLLEFERSLQADRN